MTRLRDRLVDQHGSAVIWFLIGIAGVALTMFFWVGDGGRALASLADTADVAQVAARAGTRAINPNNGQLIPTDAIAAAQTELAAAGMTGTVTVGTNTVTVTATDTIDLPLLAVLGKPTHTATSTRTATVLSESS